MYAFYYNLYWFNRPYWIRYQFESDELNIEKIKPFHRNKNKNVFFFFRSTRFGNFPCPKWDPRTANRIKSLSWDHGIKNKHKTHSIDEKFSLTHLEISERARENIIKKIHSTKMRKQKKNDHFIFEKEKEKSQRNTTHWAIVCRKCWIYDI